MSEERLIDLEMKFAHQERALEELQKTVYEQHAIIESLEKKLKLLKEKFEGTLAGGGESPANEKPPHY